MGRIFGRRGGSRGGTLTRSAPQGQGWIAWTPSSQHATLQHYELRVRTYPAGTLSLTYIVGKPVVNTATGQCHANIAHNLNLLPEDDYTVSVAAVSAGGTTDSDVSDVFSVPLT